MIVLVLLISFILEGIVSNLVPAASLFIPLFSVTALLVIYPLFNDNKNLQYTKKQIEFKRTEDF